MSPTENTLEPEFSLQDKVDVAWDFLLDVNTPQKQDSLTPVQNLKINSFIKKMQMQGKRPRAIRRLVESKFNTIIK